LLLGLLPNYNGNIKLFGGSLPDNREKILADTGCLIEQPSLYEHLSGLDNLEITRRIRNVKKSQIDKVIMLVDLKAASRKKVKEYSLGMKQRLGLAIALLSDPALLILDEPVNGLDPNGIIEIRTLLLRLNKEFGVTIFLSSHLLSEVDKIVSHLGVLNHGKLVFQGLYSKVKTLQQQSATIQINTNNNQKALEILRPMFNPTVGPETFITINYQNEQQVAAACRLLVEENIDVYRVQLEKNDLENIFLEITKS
jgi:ABC-2 type transport system ATP-binding protein